MSAGAAQHKVWLQSWLATASSEGWIDEAEIRRLEALESRGAEALFEARGERPLTVGFFGGTGVGKSSLLNRLIGESVAEVGVERPTSTQVTLYVHEYYPLGNLDELFPVERVRVASHRRDEYRDVVWIDMPDIDSVERTNRELVFEWLPYIDWLVYVVSPERYRDDAGWRVLKQRGHRHHWLFVMNRWDTGSVEQYQDFARILEEAGIEGAALIRTSCTAPVGDDFDSMMAAVDGAVAEHGLATLQAVGERARLDDLRHQCERYAAMLGDANRWRRFAEAGEAAIGEKLESLIRYLKDETAIEAAHAAGRSTDSPSAVVEPPAPPRLIAEYVQDIASAIAVARDDLPAGPVDSRTGPVLALLEQRMADAVRRGFREGTARPGNVLQRRAAALMKRLVYGLPLIACAGIAYVVVVRYQRGLSGTDDFLGFDFLAHSLMVLGLAALIPYLLARLLRPSVRRSIVKRVDNALRLARSEVIEGWREAMEDAGERRQQLEQSLASIRADIERE
ncbi:MAG: GTPase domain-containing protein [Gammaproteobacteria bacterium]|nr:GTPase domain-containing protein [Gammaproteobacteria bacterium]